MTEVKKGSDGSDDSNDNPPKIDPDNPKPEDVKNLQKLLSNRDVKLKAAEKVIADAEKLENEKKEKEEKEKKEKEDKDKSDIQKLNDKIDGLQTEIGNFNTEKKKESLAKEYPDIEPDLLVGKTDEQIKDVVEKQRERSKKLYGDSKGFIKPKYESIDDIDKEIELVKNDKTQRGDQGALKVLQLKREKAEFNSHLS